MKLNNVRHSALVLFLSCSFLLPVVQDGHGEGGISGSGFYRGAISRFRSVIMNDIEFRTQFGVTQTSITINGVPSLESDLRVGQQIELAAANAQELADSIVYRSNIIGPIEEIAPGGETITVMGQEVALVTATFLENAPVFTLGMTVEVSGIRDATRTVIATFVRGIDLPTQARLVGRVTQAPGVGVELEVDGLDIDLATASVIGVDPGGLIIGDQVEVVGTFTGGTLNAATLEQLAPAVVAGLDLVELDAFVTNSAPPRFNLDNQVVLTSPATLYINGDVNNIIDNVRLEAEGNINSDGELVAARILFKPLDEIALRGPISDITILDVNYGFATVLGMPIEINPASEFGTGGSSMFHAASIHELSVGDYLRVEAFVGGETTIARRIERREFDDKARMTSLVVANNNGLFNLLGALVSGNGHTRFKLNGKTVSAATFANGVQVGDFMRVRWDDVAPQGTTLPAPDRMEAPR